MWVEIDSQAPSAVDLIQRRDPERYSSFTFSHGPLARDFAATIPFTENPTPQLLAEEYDAFKERWWEATPQSLEIIAQVARALRQPLPGADLPSASHLYFAGISQTGGVVRRFIERKHAIAGFPGAPVFDGYLPAASGGAALEDIDVPVIELLGEAELQSVRWACGVSGQVRGLSHRRADSPKFRLFEVAGMAHRETRYMSESDAERLRESPLPDGASWSTYPNSFVYGAVLALLTNWVEHGIEPPRSRHIMTRDAGDEVVRDALGNARGGIRGPHVDVPLSQLVAATPMGRPSWYHGHEIPLSSARCRELYGSPDEYRRQLSRALSGLVEQRFLLSEDAEELRREGERADW